MAEQVDASDSKSDSERSAGSIPARGTKVLLDKKKIFQSSQMVRTAGCFKINFMFAA